MKPIFILPHFLLRHVISHFMIVIKREDKHKPYSSYSPFPPTPQNCINFYPSDLMMSRKTGENFTYLPESVIIGPQANRVDLSMGSNHIVISVAFHPGGLHRLIKVPMYEIYDEPVDATAILGKEISELNQRLKWAANPEEMVGLLEIYLLRELKELKPSPFELSMYTLLHSKSNLTMDEAASLSCLSLRQFERRSNEILGYSPKFFSKLIRFSRAYRLKVNRPELNWGDIANQNSYFDQAHLIKDFKHFTSVMPKFLNKEILLSGMQVQKDLKI